jgi:serine protease Do
MKHLLCIAILAAAAIPVQAQDPGWIGIRVEDQKDRGVIVKSVEPNSPASKAGLKENDVIMQFNKEDVAGVQQFTRLVRETPVGRTVELKVRRDNRDQTLRVTTERSPRPGFDNFDFNDFNLRLPNVRIRPRDIPQVQVNTTFSMAGIRVERLTDQLRDFFGVYSNGGVLVTSVDAGSAAEKAGLKAGDVITSIDGKMIRSTNDFSREMRARGAKATLKIVRDKQEREILLENQ